MTHVLVVVVVIIINNNKVVLIRKSSSHILFSLLNSAGRLGPSLKRSTVGHRYCIIAHSLRARLTHAGWL